MNAALRKRKDSEEGMKIVPNRVIDGRFGFPTNTDGRSGWNPACITYVYRGIMLLWHLVPITTIALNPTSCRMDTDEV